MSNECCAGRSEFFLRAEPERSEGGRARRLKTARAWPRAAQQTKKITSLIDFYILKKIKKTGHKQNL